MINPKMESRNKKMAKSLPKHCVFLFFCGVCALKYHARSKFLIGGREMAVVFGKCGCECLSVPGNTEQEL